MGCLRHHGFDQRTRPVHVLLHLGSTPATCWGCGFILQGRKDLLVPDPCEDCSARGASRVAWRALLSQDRRVAARVLLRVVTDFRRAMISPRPRPGRDAPSCAASARSSGRWRSAMATPSGGPCSPRRAREPLVPRRQEQPRPVAGALLAGWPFLAVLAITSGPDPSPPARMVRAGSADAAAILRGEWWRT